MNIVQILFTFVIIIIFIIGGFTNFCTNYTPHFLKQLILYGKFAAEERVTFINKLEVPKRWFQHFYIMAVPLATFALCLTIGKFFFNYQIAEYIYFILDFSLGNKREASVPPANTLLALFLLTIHIYKRLFETQKISIFSDAKINIAHYLIGFLHYFFTIIVIIGESKGFVKGSEVNFQNSLQIRDCLGTFVFLWMTCYQLNSNLILSNLRKNKKGVVVTKEYKLPKGGLFDYISSPLQFTEIGVYGALLIILCESSTFKFIYFWVVTNQFMTALFCHQWYTKTFKDYPPSRKIIVPYLL